MTVPTKPPLERDFSLVSFHGARPPSAKRSWMYGERDELEE